MNRRDLFRAAIAGAMSSCLRWLPMPAAPEVEQVDDRRPFKSQYVNDYDRMTHDRGVTTFTSAVGDRDEALSGITYHCACGGVSHLTFGPPLIGPRGSFMRSKLEASFFIYRCVACGHSWKL